MNRTTHSILVALAAAVLVVPACSGDSEDVEADGDQTTQDGESSSDEPKAVKTDCEEVEASKGGLEAVEARGKPTVTVPDPIPGELTVEDLEEGDGAEVIPAGTVSIHYVLVGPDGTEIDSSWESGQPVDIPLVQVGEAFAGAMEGMAEGGRRQIVMPASDAFQGQSPSGIEEGDMVVFVIDLVGVSADSGGGGAEVAVDDDALAAAEERGEPEVAVPGSAPAELQVADDVVGTGDIVCDGDSVAAHYVGVDMSSGETFDSSWERGEPATFSLDGVIPGWSEGLVGMKVGGRRTLVIPGALAYGESDEDQAGQPTGDLVFTVDLVGVG